MQGKTNIIFVSQRQCQVVQCSEIFPLSIGKWFALLFWLGFFFLSLSQNPAECFVSVQRTALRTLQGAICHLKQVVRLSSKLKCFNLNQIAFNQILSSSFGIPNQQNQYSIQQEENRVIRLKIVVDKQLMNKEENLVLQIMN